MAGLGSSRQLADHRNEALTLRRMLVRVQDQARLSQGTQIATTWAWRLA